MREKSEMIQCAKNLYMFMLCVFDVSENRNWKKKIRYTQKKLERKAWAKPTQMTYICNLYHHLLRKHIWKKFRWKK